MNRTFRLTTLMLAFGYATCAQSTIELGDLKINQSLDLKSEIQQFYKETMTASLVSFETPVVRDYIQFDNGFRLNMIYQEDEASVPDTDQFYKGLWIKILVDDFDSRYKKIKKTNAKIIKDVPEKGELYFQAPGGQVFRMVKKTS